jgi:anthranilate synthase component 1
VSLDEFRARARLADNGSPRLVPVWRDVLLDAYTPVAAFAKIRHGPFAFLLESAPAGGETLARYTFMGTAPRAAWRLQDGMVYDRVAGARRRGSPGRPQTTSAPRIRRRAEIGEF